MKTYADFITFSQIYIHFINWGSASSKVEAMGVIWVGGRCQGRSPKSAFLHILEPRWPKNWLLQKNPGILMKTCADFITPRYPLALSTKKIPRKGIQDRTLKDNAFQTFWALRGSKNSPFSVGKNFIISAWRQTQISLINWGNAQIPTISEISVRFINWGNA